MANVAMAFVDTRPNGFPGMENYFRLAKKVRVAVGRQDLFIDRVIPVDDMSLITLAMHMAQDLKPGYSALFYTHGEPANILFPIAPTTKKDYLHTADAARFSCHLDLIEQNPFSVGQGIVNPFIAMKDSDTIDVFHQTHFDDTTPDYLKIKKYFAERARPVQQV